MSCPHKEMELGNICIRKMAYCWKFQQDFEAAPTECKTTAHQSEHGIFIKGIKALSHLNQK